MESRIAGIVVLVIVVVSMAAGLIVGAQRDDRAGSADLIVHDGVVFTGAGRPPAEAVAIRGAQILRVGTSAEIRRLAGRTTRMVDARGGSVLPGFVDAHLHFVSGGLNMDRANLLDAQTLPQIEDVIRAFAKANPDRPWVLGRGWYYTPFPGGLPTRQQLDALVPDRPAYMTCYDGHTAWANTKALQLAGITAATPDPPGGAIVKDPRTGEPTGVLKEAAKELMATVLPKPTPDDRLRAIRKALGEAARLGITSIHEAGTDAADLALFDRLQRAGELTVRLYAALDVTEKMTPADADAFDALRTTYAANPRITVGAVKLYEDGVIEAHTAALLAPYTNTPARGTPNYTPQELQRIVTMMDARGWQVMTHAIGDAAVRATLDAYEAAAKANPAPARGRRHRIEHAETIDPGDVPRFAGLNVLVSYMPFHANPNEAQMGTWRDNLGPVRAGRGWIVRTLQQAKARVVFGSDWPVVALDPRLEVNMAVTRRTPEGTPAEGWHAEEAISLDAALEAMTTAGAYASFDEQKKGRLAPGFLADIVILSKNILGQAAPRIMDAAVATTIVDGQIVYPGK